ncbi:MAG: hypothetical protein U0U70_02170 [Chitinophagaceae bacterium]
MQKRKTIYSGLNKVTSVFLVLALLWLTISTPFVFAVQQKQAKADKIENTRSSDADDDTSNPLGNNTEEKAPSGTSLSEEFLHHPVDHLHFFAETIQHAGHQNDGTYNAFHGELLVPPPNAC